MDVCQRKPSLAWLFLLNFVSFQQHSFFLKKNCKLQLRYGNEIEVDKMIDFFCILIVYCMICRKLLKCLIRKETQQFKQTVKVFLNENLRVQGTVLN